jgi:hypothetical protein
MYRVVHIESDKSVVIKQEGFNRNEILLEASKKMETEVDIKQYGQYRIHPHSN